jgi:hypothetical protein
LRVVAVIGLSLEILYFWHSGGTSAPALDGI